MSSRRRLSIRNLRIAVAVCMCVTALTAIPCLAYPVQSSEGSPGETQLWLDKSATEKPEEESPADGQSTGTNPGGSGSGTGSRGYADLPQMGAYLRRERLFAFLLAGESVLLLLLVLKRDEGDRASEGHGWVRV